MDFPVDVAFLRAQIRELGLLRDRVLLMHQGTEQREALVGRVTPLVDQFRHLRSISKETPRQHIFSLDKLLHMQAEYVAQLQRQLMGFVLGDSRFTRLAE